MDVKGRGAARLKPRVVRGHASLSLSLQAQGTLPALTGPVNDFAHVIDPASTEGIDRMVRALLRATGDVVVVATVETIAPYSDIREYAVKLFENHRRGIGEKGKDNGLLIVLAVNERRVWIEVGYDLEQFITDGFAGEVSRQMVPAFRRSDYGEGLRDGVFRIVQRIADSRGVRLTDVPQRQPAHRRGADALQRAGAGLQHEPP